MDEIWARAAVVFGLLATAGVVVALLRYRARTTPRRLDVSRLGPGIHFFSSQSCSTCSSARGKLSSVLGADGYVEHTWEDDPRLFDELGIHEVPAVALVDDGGRGRLFPGQPDRALAVLGP